RRRHTILSLSPPPPRSTLFPYTTLFRSCAFESATVQRSSAARAKGSCGRWSEPSCTTSRRKNRATVQSIITRTFRLIVGILDRRSEEHTSELQSRSDLVCRLLLEKKNKD